MDIYQKHVNPVIKQDQLSQTYGQKPAPAPKGDMLDLEPMKKLDAKQYSLTAKNANEAIGILQIAEIRINKAQKAVGDLDWMGKAANDPSLDPASKASLKEDLARMVGDVNGILESATFMQKPIFGEELNVRMGSRDISLSLEIPYLDAEKVGEAGHIPSFLDSLSEKKGAIKETLQVINQSLSEGVDDGVKDGYDFNTFDATAFKKMMGK